MVQSAIEDKDFQALYYIAYKKMSSLEPVDIDLEEIADEDVKWDDDVIKDLRSRLEKIR